MSVTASSSLQHLKPKWFECLPLTRRETLEINLDVVEHLIERAEKGEFSPEFLERQKVRREQITKELETIKEQEATN